MTLDLPSSRFAYNDWVSNIEGLSISIRTIEVTEQAGGGTLSILQLARIGPDKLRIESTDVIASKSFQYFKMIKQKIDNYFVLTKAKFKVLERVTKAHNAKLITTGAAYTLGSDKVELTEVTGFIPKPLDEPQNDQADAPNLTTNPLDADVELIPLAADTVLIIVSLVNYPQPSARRIVFVKLIGTSSSVFAESYFKQSPTKLKAWLREGAKFGIASKSIFFNPNV